MCALETFTYDPWGNILTLGPKTTTQPNYVGCTQESGFNYNGLIATNNRVAASGFSYDAAGNMTASPGFTYVYDAENHLTTTAGVNYTYDGDGKRVMKSKGTIYWYGTSNDAYMETDLSNNMKFQYYFFNGGWPGFEKCLWAGGASLRHKKTSRVAYPLRFLQRVGRAARSLIASASASPRIHL